MQYLLAIILLIVAYYLWKYSKREGFTSGNTPKDMLKKIQDMNTELIDTLNVSSYRDTYELIIKDLQSWADHERLLLLTQKTTIKTAEQFNELTMFKKNLMDFAETVDNID